MRKRPVIDWHQCTGCDSCLEVCPSVFRKNEETGLIEVADLLEFPEDQIIEAISICPEDCITWEED